jgi:hypothetical protein
VLSIIKASIFALLLFSGSVYARVEVNLDIYRITPTQVLYMFEEQEPIDITALVDITDKTEKINACISSYKKMQSSYSKTVKDNLYNLIHNFSKVVSKLSNKQQKEDTMSYEDKVEVLAGVQCEAYYAMRMLK